MSGLPNQFETSGMIVLVGAGSAALDRLNLLRAAGRDVRWFPAETDVGEEIVLLNAWRRGRFQVRMDDPLAADLSDAAAVVSAAGGPLDEAIARRAQANGIPIHVVGRPDLSTFGFPDDRGGPQLRIPAWACTVLAKYVAKWLPGRRRNSTACQEAL
jgi:siroheme synthase (precorrin-2 oxidase/ferrochelatase)